MLYIVLSTAYWTFELMRYVVNLRHVLDPIVVMFHWLQTDLTFHLPFRMCALHMVSFRSLRLQNLSALGTRELSRFVRAFMDLKTFRIKERFPANVAYAIRIVLVKVGS